MNLKKNTVLIIEDEPPLRKLLTIVLDSRGYKVVDSDNGKEGLRLAASVKPDLVIVDLGLPDMDGKEIIQKIREWSQMPIIVCSVRSDDDEIIRAFDLGANDYVTKPFNPDILLARAQACLRKAVTQEAGEPELTNGNVRIDLVRHEVFVNGQKTMFTPKEYELLRYFMVNRGKMLMHKQILKDVWGPAHAEDMQYLRVYVSQIREKIEDSGAENCCVIVTEPGIGYRLENAPITVAADKITAAA